MYFFLEITLIPIIDKPLYLLHVLFLGMSIDGQGREQWSWVKGQEQVWVVRCGCWVWE
jgi:hypothetical protein